MRIENVEIGKATVSLTDEESSFLYAAMNEAMHALGGWKFGAGRAYWKGLEIMECLRSPIVGSGAAAGEVTLILSSEELTYLCSAMEKTFEDIDDWELSIRTGVDPEPARKILADLTIVLAKTAAPVEGFAPSATVAAQWRKQACGLIGVIADESVQREDWFGPERMEAAPAEIYRHIFDRLMIDDFLTSSEIKLTEKQKAAGRNFVEAIKAAKKLMTSLPPAELIDHPQWRELRRISRDLLDLWGCRKYSLRKGYSLRHFEETE